MKKSSLIIKLYHKTIHFAHRWKYQNLENTKIIHINKKVKIQLISL